MPNFVSAQSSMVLYLEDPAVTCAKTRVFVDATVSNGATATLTGFPTTTKAANQCVFLTYSPVYTGQSSLNPLPNGTVTLTFYYRVSGQYQTKTKSVTFPTTGFIAISLTELLDVCQQTLNTSYISYTFTNNSGVSLRLLYATYGCLMVYTRTTGLVGCSYGDRMGNDESYPDFGMCRAHGEAKIKDVNGTLRQLCLDASAYGVTNNFFKYDCRAEFFLGSVLDGTFELDDLVYSSDEIYVTVRLKSPLLRLDNYVTGGPKIVYVNTELSTYIRKYVDFATNGVGIPLGMYDFSDLYDYVPWDDVIVGFPLLGDDITVAQFVDYVGQLTCSNIAIRSQMSVSMVYRLDVLYWFNLGQSVTHEGTLNGPTYNQNNILSTIQYNPIKGNFVDKLTYTPYVITLEDFTDEETTVFPITELRNYTSLTDDLQAYNSYWAQKSPTSVDYLSAPYGTLYPRPQATGGSGVGDLEYDSSRGKWGVHMNKLENMMKRSLTRGFLWRFQIVTDYSGVNTKTKVKQSYLNVLEQAHSQAAYMASQPSSFSEGYLLGAGGADLAGTNSTFDVIFRGRNESTHLEEYAQLNVRPSGIVKRTSYKNQNLINPSDTHELYANVGSGKYLSTSSAITLAVYVSYWYTTIFGGGYANADAETSEGQSGQERLDTLRGAMRKVSPYDVSQGGGPDNRLYVKTWAESKATKMSEYIRLEETSEQYYCYRAPWSGNVMRPCDFMLWTTFGDDSLHYIPSQGFSFRYAPVQDYKNAQQDPLFRVGLWKGADGSQEYTVYDVASVEGHGVNSLYAYNQRGWGYRLFWEEGSYPNETWYHTGEDSNAHGGYLQLASVEKTVTNVEFDANGRAIVGFTMPSAASAKAAIMASDDNFLGEGTYSSDHPGRGKVDDANAWLTFWNTAYAYSVFTRSSLPGYETNPIGENAIENLDGSAGSNITWMTGRPMYGYVLKDVKVVATVTNCYSVQQGESKVVQVGKENKYNYTLDTNPLMYNTTYLSTDIIAWAIGQITSAFSNGRYVLRFKCKAAMNQTLTGSGTTYVAPRPPRMGDEVDASMLTIIKNGVPAKPIESVNTYFVRGVEVVNEEGELYYNMELMQKS